MEFRNERTWQNAVEIGKTEEFHVGYETAVDRVRSEFGQTLPIIIDGKEVRSTATFPDVSPADIRVVVGLFKHGTKAHAKRAIKAARAAFRTWSATPWAERVRIVQRASDLISERKYRYAALLSFENGKNRYEAMADVDEAADLMRWYASEMNRNRGYEHTMGQFLPGETARAMLKPYGVWAVVAPFNFPFAIAGGMSTGALITGNTVVFKPASDTPYMGLELAELLHEAGLPPGVFNYVTGAGATVGQELVDNPEVDGFVFTGSRAVGLAAFKTFTQDRPKPIITEMGGKNPTIVTASADLEKAALGVMRAAFGYGGENGSQDRAFRRSDDRGGAPAKPSNQQGGVVRPDPLRHRGGRTRRCNRRRERRRLWAHRRDLLPRTRGGAPLLLRGRSRRPVCEPSRRCDDRGRRRGPTVRRMEDVRDVREVCGRPLLPAAVHARAKPVRVCGLTEPECAYRTNSNPVPGVLIYARGIPSLRSTEEPSELHAGRVDRLWQMRHRLLQWSLRVSPAGEGN